MGKHIITSHNEQTLIMDWLTSKRCSMIDAEVIQYIGMCIHKYIAQSEAFHPIISLRYANVLRHMRKAQLRDLGDLCLIDAGLIHSRSSHNHNTYKIIGKNCYAFLSEQYYAEGSGLFGLYDKLSKHFDSYSMHLTRIKDQKTIECIETFSIQQANDCLSTVTHHSQRNDRSA